jgi:hypothetical protein
MKTPILLLAAASTFALSGCRLEDEGGGGETTAGERTSCLPREAPPGQASGLSDAERAAGWKLLFNGRDLTGFQKPTREGKWAVEDGILVGTGGAGVLATVETFDNFILELRARVQDTGERRGNSGIFIRSSSLTGLRNRWPDGPEIQIDHGDPEYWTGAIWKTARAREVETRDGEWFGMTIEALGPRIRVSVNGELVTEHELEGEVREGPIALQVHHPTDRVEFESLKILRQ